MGELAVCAPVGACATFEFAVHAQYKCMRDARARIRACAFVMCEYMCKTGSRSRACAVPGDYLLYAQHMICGQCAQHLMNEDTQVLVQLLCMTSPGCVNICACNTEFMGGALGAQPSAHM